MWNDIKWGNQYFCCDYSELSFALYNRMTVVALDDDGEKYSRIGCVMMSILLPPLQSIEAEINGDFQQAQLSYEQWLMGDTCSRVFAAICTALYAEKNIVLFVSPDEAKNLGFAQTINTFLLNVLGLPGGSLKYPESGILNPDPYMVSNRLDLMYAYGFIPFDRYCDEHPDVLPLDMVSARVAHDVQSPELMNMLPDDRVRCCGDIIIANREQRKELFAKTGSYGGPKIMPIVMLHDWQRRI